MATATKTTAAPKRTAKTKATSRAAKQSVAATEKAAETVQDYFSNFLNQMAGASEDMRERAEDAAEDMRTRFEKQQEAVADLNADIVEAAKQEVSDAVQFASDLGQAKSFGDAIEIQQAYWKNLFETRVERAQDMTSKSVDAVKDAFNPAPEGFDALFDMSAFPTFFQSPKKA